MLKIALTAPLFLAAVLMPSASIAEDCGTSVTECELRQEIKKLKRKVTILEQYQNIRTIVTKDQADRYCPQNSYAAHVPLSYAGATGNQICAANDKEEKTCKSVLFVFVNNRNQFGRYSDKDKQSCQERISHPWPWGNSSPAPNTSSAEWGYGNNWVVCCRR